MQMRHEIVDRLLVSCVAYLFDLYHYSNKGQVQHSATGEFSVCVGPGPDAIASGRISA